MCNHYIDIVFDNILELIVLTVFPLRIKIYGFLLCNLLFFRTAQYLHHLQME
jgi:hypothetical protein